MRQALPNIVANLCAGRVEFLAPEEVPSAVRASRSSRVYTLHNHSYMEIVQLIDGMASLDLGQKTMPLHADRTYLVLPDTVHCEQPIDGRKKYALLWGVVGPAGLSFFTSVYRGAGRYLPTPERFTCLAACCDELWICSTISGIVDDALKRAKLQALVVQACAQAVEDMDKTPRTQTDHLRTIVEQIRSYLYCHYQESITVRDLAQMVRCTPNHLNTVFRKHTGMPIHQFLIRKRLKQACELLRDESIQIKQVAFKTGFTDPLYFSRLFKKHHRVSPSTYRRRAAGRQ